MILLRLMRDYLVWHYGLALPEIWLLERNLIRFLYHFFSVPVIIKTLFTPWRRLTEARQSILYPGDFFSALLVNGLMRSFGFLIRIIFLIVSLIILSLVLVAIPLTFVFWFLLPLIFGLVLFLGIYLLLY